MKAKKIIFWDVDGTIFSSEELIHQVYSFVFEQTRIRQGWPETTPTHDQIMMQIGKPVKTIFMNLVPEITEDQRDYLSLMILHRLVSEITFGKGHFYEGYLETFVELQKRGYQFVTASNGRYPYVEAILRYGKLLPMFRFSDCIDNKTVHDKNELVAWTLHKSGLTATQAVLIGDRSSDNQAAQKNAMDFVACSYGHGESAEWTGAAAVIDSLPELLKILE